MTLVGFLFSLSLSLSLKEGDSSFFLLQILQTSFELLTLQFSILNHISKLWLISFSRSFACVGGCILFLLKLNCTTCCTKLVIHNPHVGKPPLENVLNSSLKIVFSYINNTCIHLTYLCVFQMVLELTLYQQNQSITLIVKTPKILQVEVHAWLSP